MHNVRLVFSDVIFPILIFLNKVTQKTDYCGVLAQVCIVPMLSKFEKILMSLNSNQNSLCQLATIELYPKDTK